jgi:N-methylhydantoinase B/oxoprolinase/acetone carboxylase alpha subunit
MLNPHYRRRGGGRQRRDLHLVTNALYGALGLMAAGQCTMNNFTFGNERHQYYETISGGGAARWRGSAASLAPASCRPT